LNKRIVFVATRDRIGWRRNNKGSVRSARKNKKTMMMLHSRLSVDWSRFVGNNNNNNNPFRGD
jgi:hypothetical protein